MGSVFEMTKAVWAQLQIGRMGGAKNRQIRTLLAWHSIAINTDPISRAYLVRTGALTFSSFGINPWRAIRAEGRKYAALALRCEQTRPINGGGALSAVVHFGPKDDAVAPNAGVDKCEFPWGRCIPMLTCWAWLNYEKKGEACAGRLSEH